MKEYDIENKENKIRKKNNIKIKNINIIFNK